MIRLTSSASLIIVFLLFVVVLFNLKYFATDWATESPALNLPLDNDTTVSHVTLEGVQKPLVNWCNTDTYNDGEWVSRSGLQGLEGDEAPNKDLASLAAMTVQDIFNKSGYHCPEITFSHFCGKRKGPSELERAAEIADWVWKPDCEIRPFDPTAMVHRFIQKGALLIVGDSLSEEQFISLACLLGQHIQMNKQVSEPVTGIKKNPFVSRTLNLRQESPLRRLLPADDQDRDLVVWIRSDLLAQHHDFSIVLPDQDLPDGTYQPTTQKWTHVLLAARHNSRSKVKLENVFAYAILSTGPHWALHRWGWDESQTSLLLAKYNEMVRQVTSFVVGHAASRGIKVFIRSSVAGHEKCTTNHFPLVDDPPIDSLFNWPLFHRFNDYWKVRTSCTRFRPTL